MSRHPLRWESLVFGLLFLAAAGNWAVWKQDLLTPREFSLTASGLLILFGLIGVAATLWQARPTPAPPAPPVPEGDLDEDTDPPS